MAENSKTLSFEFFPPKTPLGQEKLVKTAQNFEDLGAEYFSVTFGAGGSTQQGTLDTCSSLFNSTKTPIAPHISGIGSDKDIISLTLNQYKDRGLRKLVVLRGDLPSGFGAIGDFPYAVDLIDYINVEFNDYFEIEVGAYPETHPEAISPEQDIKYFCEKMSRNVQGAVTQFFYDPEVYLRFVENCQKYGCDKPITPGIMPITNKDVLIRMASNCGAKLPESLLQKLDSYSNEEDIEKFGSDYVSSLVRTLINNGAPGIHFYTINKLEPTKHIIDRLD
jgi:methylenetetrahydrofolate reductase (NADPH)